MKVLEAKFINRLPPAEPVFAKPNLTQASSWACRALWFLSPCLSPTLLLLTANLFSISLSAYSKWDLAMRRLSAPKGGLLWQLTTLCLRETRRILPTPPNQEPAAPWPSGIISVRPSSLIPACLPGISSTTVQKPSHSGNGVWGGRRNFTWIESKILQDHWCWGPPLRCLSCHSHVCWQHGPAPWLTIFFI